MQPAVQDHVKEQIPGAGRRRGPVARFPARCGKTAGRTMVGSWRRPRRARRRSSPDRAERLRQVDDSEDGPASLPPMRSAARQRIWSSAMCRRRSASTGLCSTVERFMRLTSDVTASEIDRALAATSVPHLRRRRSATSPVENSSGPARPRRGAPAGPYGAGRTGQGVDHSGEIHVRADLQIATRQAAAFSWYHTICMSMAATDHVICLNGHICCEGRGAVASSANIYSCSVARRARRLPSMSIITITCICRTGVRHWDGSVTRHCHPDDGHHRATGTRTGANEDA